MLNFLNLVFSQIIALFGYFSGSKDFPHPLCKEEETDCLAKAKLGDKKAREKLIEHNLRLVAYSVQKYKNCGIETSDLISIGTIGLIKGIDTYKGGKATKLATYAIRCIENEILMVLRASKKWQSDVSLDEPFAAESDGKQISLSDIIKDENADVYEKIENTINREKLSEMLEKLTQREREILNMRYGLTNGIAMPQRDVAQILGISRSYVSRIETKIIKKLRAEK